VDSVIALLTDDAWLAMPPAPHEYLGHEAIARFLLTSIDWRQSRQLELVPTRANGQPAFACYLRYPGRVDRIRHRRPRPRHGRRSDQQHHPLPRH